MLKLFKVGFYLRSNHVNKDGSLAIMVRVTCNGERLSFGNTGYSVPKNFWDGTKNRAMPRYPQAALVNSHLNAIESELTLLFRKNEFAEDFSLEKIRNIYNGNDVSTTNLLEYYDMFLERRNAEVGRSISPASMQKYNVVRKHLGNYLKKDHHINDLPLEHLNFKIISGFEHYLTVDGGCQNNTIMRMLRTFKTVIIQATKEGLLTKDPFQDVKIRFKPVDRGFLTETEIAAMAQKDFGIRRLEVVRDLFVFSCYTGLAYIDMANLKWENIKELDGAKWIIARRQKTNVSCNVPLLPIPLIIMDKYQGQGKDGKVFPIISNQKMNSFLKEIGAACGIEKELTFHLARHTFATLALTKGVAVESVSKMLGHTNIKTTQLYAKITSQKVKADMEALQSRLSNFATTQISAHSTEEPPVVEKPRRGRPRIVR